MTLTPSEIQKATKRIEEEKREKQRVRQEKKEEKERRIRQAKLERLVAPILLIFTVLLSALLLIFNS